MAALTFRKMAGSDREIKDGGAEGCGCAFGGPDRLRSGGDFERVRS